jgi:hypothetical protein
MHGRIGIHIPGNRKFPGGPPSNLANGALIFNRLTKINDILTEE